jgi:cytochrome c peroxidase
MRYAFKTPSLRNAAIRPPYMHNGSLDSLNAVLDHYQSKFQVRPSLSSMITRVALSDHEKLNVIEFLNSLTDDRLRDQSADVSPQ